MYYFNFFFFFQLIYRYVLLHGICTRKPPLLLVAAAFGDLDIVKYLLSQGANPNVCDISSTKFHKVLFFLLFNQLIEFNF